MKKLTLVAVVLMVFCLTLSAIEITSAEMNLNLYLGASNTFNTSNTALSSLEGGRSTIVGGRLQYWESTDDLLGVGFDVSSFEIAKGNFLTGSGLVMLKIPLGKEYQYPNGRFFPYLGIGPSLVTGADTKSFAFDFRSGMAWYYDISFAIFAEHRILNSTDFKTPQFIGGVQLRFK